MPFSISPLLKSALEEGFLVFAVMVFGAFVLNASGVVTALPTSPVVAYAALAGVIAALRDYMTGGNASSPPPAA